MFLNQSHGSQAQKYFAKQVSGSGKCRALPDVHEPLARNCLFYQSCLPERAGQPWKLEDGISESRSCQPDDECRRDGADRAIQSRQHDRAKFAEVPGHAVRNDLAAPVGQQLVATGEAFEHHVHAIGDLAFLRQVGVSGQPDRSVDCVEHGLALVRRPRIEALELADQETRQQGRAHGPPRRPAPRTR